MVPYTNPMSASYGGLGGFGAMLPTQKPPSNATVYFKPPLSASGKVVGTNPLSGVNPVAPPVNLNPYTPVVPAFGSPFTTQPRTQQPTTQSSTGAPIQSLNTGSFNPQQVLTSIADRLASGAVEPLNFADADALGLTEMLDDPNSGYVKDTATNQYVPSNLGPTQATKNTAAAQRRADMAAQGLVYNKHYGWIPFKQWQRLRKQKGAKIAIAQAEAAQVQQTTAQDGFVGSFGVVSFNTDAG
jgi:hypothetical protein